LGGARIDEVAEFFDEVSVRVIKEDLALNLTSASKLLNKPLAE
jgi:hypothetical protein